MGRVLKGSDSELDNLNGLINLEFFKLLVNEIKDYKDYAIFLLDEKGRVASWNEGAERIQGYRTDEILGKHFSVFYTSEDVKRRKPEKELEMAKKYDRYEEMGIRIKKDGSEFLAHVVITALKDKKGDPIGFIKIVKDMTERKKAEKKIRETEQKYGMIFEHSPDIIIVTNLKGEFVEVNKAFEDILGYTRDEVIGQSYKKWVAEEYIEPLIREYSRSYEEGIDIRGVEFEVVTKKGERIFLEGNITPIRENGRVVAFLGNFREITERKKLEEKLKESEELYRKLFESANDAIFLLRGEVFIECNSKTLEMFGCKKKEDIIGKTPFDFSPPKQPDGRGSKEVALERIEAALRGEPQIFEWRHRRLDGGFFDVEVSLNKIELRKNTYLLAIVRDVSEKKRLEREVERKEELYRSIIENTGTAMVIVEFDGEIVFANKEVERLFGLPRAELIGKKWVDFVPEDEKERLLEFSKLRRIAPELVPRSYEIKVFDASGRVRYVLSTVTQIPNTERLTVSLIDITELKKAERELKESEERYRTLFEKSRDGIVVIGPDMRIIECNDAALQIPGLSKEDVIGKTFLELGLFDKKEVPFLLETYYRGMREEIGTLELKITVRGETKWVEVSPTTLRKKNGEIFGFLSIIRDITERKKAEEELKLSLTRLRIIHELDLGMIEGKPFKEMAKKALHNLKELLGCEIAGLFNYVPERKISLECKDTDAKIFDEGTTLPLESTLLENLKKGEIVKIDDLLELETLSPIEKEMLKARMRSYIHAPMIVRGELMGILCLASERPRAFNEKIQFIKEISDQLAIALHEARLFEMRIKSLERIEKNIEEFAILVDHIRNPLAIIAGTTELEIKDERVRKILHDAVNKIEEVVTRLDKGWLESEEIREFLTSRKSWQ